MSASTLSVVLGLVAAILFAVGNQFSRIGLRFADARTATTVQILVGAGVYWLIAPFYLEGWYWVSAAMPWLIAAGLLRPILSANLGMLGTRLLGPTVSSTLSATAPLFGVTFGLVILAEALSLAGAIGTACIVGAVVLLSTQGKADRAWPMFALLLPIGAALIRSVTHGFAKIALETVPDPYFVALVTYSVSVPLALGERWWRLGTPRVQVAPGGLRWLVGMALAYALAVLALNTALLKGTLVVVSPIVACSPVFTLLLGRFVFNEQMLNVRAALAVGLVVPGVILIGLDG